MRICPNRNLAEWKALVAEVGEFEAYRDFLENNGEIRSVAPVQDKISDRVKEDRLFGLDTANPEFHINTLNVITKFLDALGVEQRLVPEFLSQTGTPIESALAAANFLTGTVDIIEQMEKRPDAWNKVPEEAAHFFYRLLKQDSALKKLLWDTTQTGEKTEQLFKQGGYTEAYGIKKYNYTIQDMDILREEAIGQLIAEAIKRIQDKKGSPKDYSFFKRFLSWINHLLQKYKDITNDPYEVAAMKILSTDMTDLMTWEEYKTLHDIIYPNPLTNQSLETLDRIEEVEDITQQFYDYLINKKFKKQTKFLNKTLEKYFTIADSNNLQTYYAFRPRSLNTTSITKKLSDIEKNMLTNTTNYTNITPSLKGLPLILDKFKKQPISLSQSLKLDGVKKQELDVYNDVLKLIKQENPDLKSISGQDFVNETYNFLKTKYLLGFASENEHLAYRVDQTFEHVPDRVAQIGEYNFDVAGMTDEQVAQMTPGERSELANRLGLNRVNPKVAHRKISIRFNNSYFTRGGHFKYSPSAWGNLTDFYLDEESAKTGKKNATLLHEIQNDQIEFLRSQKEQTGMPIDDEFKNYLHTIEQTSKRNKTYLESGGKEIVTDMSRAYHERFAKTIIGRTITSNLTTYSGSTSFIAREVKEKINEQVNLYNPVTLQEDINRSDTRVQNYYRQKWQLKDFLGRGGLKSILNSDELAHIEKKLKIISGMQGEVDNSRYLPEENQYEEDTREINLKDKKREAKSFLKYYNETIDRILAEMYGPDFPKIELIPIAKNKTKTEKHLLGFEQTKLNTAPGSVMRYAQENALKILNKNLSEAKSSLNMAYNTLSAYNFNKKAQGLSFTQLQDIVENFEHNANLLFKGIDDLSQKRLAQQEQTQIENREDRLKEQTDLLNYHTEGADIIRTNLAYETELAREKNEEIIDREMNYFAPLVHHLIQTHIKEKGKSFPMYFSGFAITMLTQGSQRTAEIYAGPEEVKEGLVSKVGPLYLAMSKLPGISLEYKKSIPGFIQDIGGYKVNLDNYKYEAPLLYGLDTNSSPANVIKEGLDQYESLNGVDLPVSLNTQEINHTRAIGSIVQLLQRLSTQLGVKYEMVTKAQAEDITKDAKNSWNGESAFYLGDTVYFLGDRLTDELVLHEFSHPLVRAISKADPILFNNLFQKVLSTTEGQNILSDVTELYPELTPENDLFKEEVIVRALASSAKNTLNKVNQSTGFIGAIRNILYAVKQMLRKMFGSKIRVEDLNENTSLDKLGEMLVGENFDLTSDKINESDVVAYSRSQKQEIENLSMLSDEGRQEMINNIYELSSKHLSEVIKRGDIKEMELYKDIYGLNRLQEVKSEIRNYKSDLERDLTATKADMDLVNEQLKSMVSSLFTLEGVAKDIYEYMKEISADPNNKDALQKFSYYNQTIEYWNKFIKNSNDQLDKAGVHYTTPIRTLLTSIGSSLNNASRLSDNVYKNALKDILWEQIAPIATEISDHYTKLIDNLQKKGASEATINKYKALYEKVKMSPEFFQQMLNGERGDASYLNSYLEGYMYNSDPVIASFALYLKNAMHDVLNKAQTINNKFAEEIAPLLKDIDFNPSNVAAFGKSITFKDKIGRINDKDEFEEVEVHTLMNQHKDYRFIPEKMKHDIILAKEKAKETGDDTEVRNLVYEYYNHKSIYFHQEHLQEFYERQELFKSENGKIAKENRDKLLKQITTLGKETATDEETEDAITNELAQLWRDYQQLHSLQDLNGNKKTGPALEQAIILKQYQEISRDFYEYVEREGIFQKSYLREEERLIGLGIARDSEGFTVSMQKWVDKNTRRSISDEYYTAKARIFENITALLANLPSTTKNKVDITEAYQDIFENIYGFRDDDGQPIASNMSASKVAHIKDLQEKIIKAREEFAGLSGLTTAEMTELGDFFNTIKAEKKLSGEDRARMNELLSKKDELGLNKYQKAELNKLYSELAELQSKQATDYYLAIFNNYLTKMDTNNLFLDYGTRALDKDTADFALNDNVITGLLAQDSEFEEWFKKNHIRRKTYNPQTRQNEMKWERLYCWNVTKPNDEKFLKTTTIVNSEGTPITIKAIPAFKYFSREVRDEFKTKKILGTNWDGQNFLPKTVEQGAPQDSPYINKDYYIMQTQDPKRFKVLDKIKTHHLSNQEGMNRTSRLYMDIPRFEKEGLETYQEEGFGKIISNWWTRTKSLFVQSGNEMEQGLNHDVKFMMAKADLFDNEKAKVPIAGIYKMDVDIVSLDVLQSISRYMLSGERQKKLIEMAPVARALQEVLSNPDNGLRTLTSNGKKKWINRGLATYKSSKEKTIRSKAIDNLIAREFEGQQNSSGLSNNKTLNTVSQSLMKAASFNFFALNIPSALKNSFSAMYQNMIESAAGKYLNPITYQQGVIWSGKASFDISMEVNKLGVKGYNQQLINMWDPTGVRSEEKFHQQFSRSLFKDAVGFSWLYSARKWTELNATLGLFGGMMYHKKINQTINGHTVEIPLIEAYEIKNGNIQLKSGIDPEWAQGGAKYLAYKNKIQQVNASLNGDFSKFGNPEVQRNVLFRMFSYMRRYTITMATNRWGRERLDVGRGEINTGWYIEAFRSFTEAVKEKNATYLWDTADKKRAFVRILSDVGMLIAMNLLMGALFGWDPDDKEKYEKLRAKSGALPSPFTVDDPEHPFNLGGWMSNHSLSLLMNIQAENRMWVPVPGLGLKDYKGILQPAPVVLGPTVNSYVNMMEDMVQYISGSDKAFYTRASGPYIWSQEGSFKLWNHLGHVLGLSGGTVDPANNIRNFQSIQARR